MFGKDPPVVAGCPEGQERLAGVEHTLYTGPKPTSLLLRGRFVDPAFLAHLPDAGQAEPGPAQFAALTPG